MITERVYPRSVEHLHAFVADKCREIEAVTLQAGHFMLRQSDLDANVTAWMGNGSAKNDENGFPLFTWQLGLGLLKGAAAARRYVSTLVNDWQYVVSDDARQRFYREHGTLPIAFARELRGTSDVRLLVPPRPRKGLHTGDFFSEQTLRNQYRRHVKRLLREQRLPPGFSVERDADSSVCTITGGPSSELAYCTGQPQTCTHEVAQFVYAVGALTRCDVLINIYPLVCRDHVEAGTDLAFSLFSASVGTVINIAVPADGFGLSDEAIKEASISVHIA